MSQMRIATAKFKINDIDYIQRWYVFLSVEKKLMKSKPANCNLMSYSRSDRYLL